MGQAQAVAARAARPGAPRGGEPGRVTVVARFEADDGVGANHELEFALPPGATAASLLAQLSERLRGTGAPRAVGLRVLRGRSTPRMAAYPRAVAAACGGLCAGEAPRARGGEAPEGCALLAALAGAPGEASLVLDYGLPVQDALGTGDAFEAVFEVACPSSARRGPGEPAVHGLHAAAAPRSPHHHSIEDFSIVQVVGVGGSGRVLQALHRPSGEMRAVKVMSKARLLEQEQRLERVVTEQRILARLAHPFVVSLHWAFQRVLTCSWCSTSAQAESCSSTCRRGGVLPSATPAFSSARSCSGWSTCTRSRSFIEI
ncbi:unnamed protein product [Prorocentrum cordatum]|uniref:non-specific serine/threonine protein kinase n=1 Tax=Prorocentrum cordatum TaxID=2364126 RepID=A0ABN9SWB6_9DINO|nr:unnamed protein product [Polarella glacialis]